MAQERAAWERAIAAAEELARSRTEDLAAVRQELGVVRGQRDRLAEQLRELMAPQADDQPPSGEAPPGPAARGQLISPAPLAPGR